MPKEGIRVKVKFQKVDDLKTAIEFTKLAGSGLYFRDRLANMKDLISMYLDATADD